MLRRRDGVAQHYRVGRKQKAKAEPKKKGEALKFYDLKGKKSFTTSEYKVVVKKGRRFAVATSPSGIPSWRILGKA
jgi:hypothetical protein